MRPLILSRTSRSTQQLIGENHGREATTPICDRRVDVVGYAQLDRLFGSRPPQTGPHRLRVTHGRLAFRPVPHHAATIGGCFLL